MRKGVLRAAMDGMVRDIAALVKEKAAGNNVDPHQSICHEISERYDLWDDKDSFPLWLSRVVEGVMRDIESGVYEE